MNFYEKVLNINQLENNLYQIETNKTTYQSHSIVVVTGFYDIPKMLNIPGEDLPKVRHYYDDWHPYIGQKVTVVGAANSSCDVALELYHKGADVTMVVRKSEVSPRVKYWIKPNIENRIKEGSIPAYFNSNITTIREREIDIQTPTEQITIENDFVLAMTGYQPDLSFLEKIGITFENEEYKTPMLNSETLETNLPNIYLAGVINAGLQTSKLFIENTRHHADLIVENILRRTVDG